MKNLPLVLMAAFGTALLVAAITAGSSTFQADVGVVQPIKTIWAGVYTKAQADRGRQAYVQTCRRCHGGDLRGSDKGPPLLGSAFFDRWHDFTLRWLFTNIQFAMPHDFQVFVSTDSARDILSFLLEQNGAPAGNEDLSTNIDALGQILITKPPK